MSSQAIAQEPSDDNRWAGWLSAVLEQLPSIQALGNSQSASEWDYKAGKKPLYNPELEFGYEDNDVEESSIGISQTLDFSGKRKAYSSKAEATYGLALVENKQKKEALYANAIHALIAYEEAKKLLNLANEQERILESTQQILLERQKVGDVSQLDVDLALLSLSGNLQHIAELEIGYNEAKSNLYATLGIEEAAFPVPSGAVWQFDLSEIDVAQWMQKAPAFLAAQHGVSVMRSDVSIAKSNKKVDPTIGLSATSDEEEDYVGLSISFPINVRNSYGAEYRAAQERLLQAELEFAAVRREITGELIKRKNNYFSQLKHWRTWQSLNASSTEESRKLVEQQWALGDISTSEYLFVLQQQAEASIAGFQLESNLKHTWVEWLLITQQVERWLKQAAFHDDTLVTNFEG